jgi:choline dehydrogenase-like flavoprotein
VQTKFDAVIIGSGAGGAPIAHTLVRAGKSVLVLEKGPLLRPQYQNRNGLSDFKRDEQFSTGPAKRLQIPGLANTGSTYYSSHVEPDLNDEPHVYRDGSGADRATVEGYTAQVVGGGTQLYGAVSLRFSAEDFRLATFNRGRTDLRNDPAGDVLREARDWPITYEQLEPYYCEAERLIGINGTRNGQVKPASQEHYQKPLDPNPISRFAAAGMDALGMTRYRTPLAVITEDHAPSGRTAADPRTAFVNRYGDPLGLKSNTWVSLLSPIAGSSSFELRPNCTVTQIEQSNGSVTRVRYRDAGGAERTVDGRVVVVACSAIESVRLLMLSALRDQEFDRRIYRNDLLGRYFLTHCFGGAEVRVPMDGRSDKVMALDSDWATDFCARPEFLRTNGMWAGGAIYNNTSDQALPLALGRTHGSQDLDTIWEAFINDPALTGEGLARFIDENLGVRLSVSFMANQVPLRSNRIALHPFVKDKWGLPSAHIIKDWHSHDVHLMNVLADQCRRVLEAGCPGGTDLSSGHVQMASNAPARIANHILGGARFGTNPDDSVLDSDCRAWEFDNLYVTDGSFMPTSGGANPTLTIQANAFRVADLLKARL